NLASFSNYGSTNVDVGAPGVNIVSQWAGTHTKTVDPMTSGWNFTSNGAAAWGYKGTTTKYIVNPTNFDNSTAKYANNLDATAWKNFTIPTADAVVLNFYMLYNLSANDYVDVYSQVGNADPSSSGTLLDSFTGLTGSYSYGQSYDMSLLANTTTSIGFNMITNASGTNTGAAISEVDITKLVLNTTSYNVISGTSMATPHVAGLAAMLFAHNPNYTYLDVINSIKLGGVATASLASKTSTGKAVSAIGSLRYITPPTGTSATKIP
ncbi:MAG: S8 family serine peptidase, partial [Bdellovibrionales bacterium]|nr:S8 family serine peptidase [Bdellovibrionales bacterium]